MKVGVVGSGLVGVTAAYSQIMRGVGREIVLVNKNEGRAVAEADDIRHADLFAHPLSEAEQCQLRASAGRRSTNSTAAPDPGRRHGGRKA